MCAQFVPVEEDSNQWRRFYNNMVDGVDHGISEYMIQMNGPAGITKSLATDQQGNIQAPISAENVEPPPASPLSTPSPGAYDDPQKMSREKYRGNRKKHSVKKVKKTVKRSSRPSSSNKRKRSGGSGGGSSKKRSRPSLGKRR